MRLALIASSLLAVAALPAHAALITYTSTFDLADVAIQSRSRDYTESLSDFRTAFLPRFDSTLGTLQSVAIDFASSYGVTLSTLAADERRIHGRRGPTRRPTLIALSSKTPSNKAASVGGLILDPLNCASACSHHL